MPRTDPGSAGETGLIGWTGAGGAHATQREAGGACYKDFLSLPNTP
ncbi:MAG: hypothetical protein ACTSRS_10590 [Candidatus Helarchaeota archaeon]